MGIDKIIALGHVGYWRKMDLARAVDGVDIIVDDPSAAGPYPTLVTSPVGETVLIVQAYQWSHYLGRLDVFFDAAGRLSVRHGAPILIDNKVPEEPGVAALVAKLNESLHEIRNEVVGASVNAIDAYDFGPVLADSAVTYLAARSPVAPQLEGKTSRADQ